MDRRTLFWSLFLGTCVVVAAIPEFWTDTSDTVVVSDTRTENGIPPSLQATAPTVVTKPAPMAEDHRRASDQIPRSATSKVVIKDIFGVKSWAPPPPKVVARAPAPAPLPPPPPAPSAPPLPFKYLGKLDDATTLKAFLNRGDKVYVVTVGEIIDNTYRVESIKAGQMTLIYMPLNIPQTLSVGSPL